MKKVCGILLLLIWIACLMPACKKKHDDNPLNRRDSILGTWSRVLRAYDVNGNHVIDSSEVKIAPATDTFLFNLAPDDTYQRIQTFKGQQFPEYGTWHLDNDQNTLILQPSSSSSQVDTFDFDTVSQAYFRYHTITPNQTRYWEGFARPY